VPSAHFTGEVRAGDRTLDITGWRGMVGHNWGADHADRWLWLHANGLGDRDPAGWIDLVVVRVKVGPLLTPWLPAGGVMLDGELHRVGAPHARGLRVEVGEERLELAIPRAPGGGLRLEAVSPRRTTVHWDYDSPGGGGRDVRNCTIASASLTLGSDPAVALPERFAVEVGA
jgi:hypothetical protein